MRILHIITGLGMGGAERVVLDLATQMKKQNHVVQVISLSKRDDLLPRFKAFGIEPIIYDFKNPCLFFLNIIRIISWINQYEIQIVHLHLAHPVLLSPFIFCFTRAKILFTSHNFNIGGKLREFYVWLLKPFRNMDILFSLNQYRYFYKKNFQIIENGIDIEQYRLVMEKPTVFTFISVGRLMKVKNQIYLIELMDKMIQIHKRNCKLLIIGDGDLRDELERTIELLHLKNQVTLLGTRNDINVLMAQSHCFLLPSLWEGLPIVLLEAGASHLPIISNDVGSISSLLDKDNSYIGALKEFETNMLFVMDNYTNACKKSERLYKKIEDSYSLESITNKHITLYRSLLKS